MSVSYRITVTPSPYKKDNGKQKEKCYYDQNGSWNVDYIGLYNYQQTMYKDLPKTIQRLKLKHFFEFYRPMFDEFLITFETTQKGSVHAHLHVQTSNYEILESMSNKFVDIFGYKGKNNKITDFILIEANRTFFGSEVWIDYMYKEYEIPIEKMIKTAST